MISRVDHVAIAVKDYDKAFSFFAGILGAVPGSSAQDPSMNYYWENLCLGDLSRLELLTPTGEPSFLDNFLRDRQGGVHHITMQTPDIDQARAVLEENQIPYFGLHDYGTVWKELFIHPRHAFGVLIQLAEFNADDWLAPSVRMPENTPFEVRKQGSTIRLRIAHPGGGCAQVSLSRDEAKSLLAELTGALDSVE